MQVRDIPPVGSTRFARLRRAVPTGGRRSLAGGTVGPGGGCAERGTICVNGDAPPAGLRPAVPTGGRRSKRSPRFGALGDAWFAALRPPCRPEVGTLYEAETKGQLRRRLRNSAASS